MDRFLVVVDSLLWYTLVYLFLKCTSQTPRMIMHSWNHPTWFILELLENQWWVMEWSRLLSRPLSFSMSDCPVCFRWKWGVMVSIGMSHSLDPYLIKKHGTQEHALIPCQAVIFIYLFHKIEYNIYRYKNLFLEATIYTISTVTIEVTIEFDPWLKGFIRLIFPYSWLITLITPTITTHIKYTQHCPID